MAASKTHQLVIVESPAKANTISRFLGPGYQVEASYGHVRDLPQSAREIPAAYKDREWARLGVDVEHDFEPLYVVPADKKKHVQRLKKALESADRLLLATDEDREGESISWHVLQLLRPPASVGVERIVFHEVTPEAIRRALESPREVDENLVRAQEARRILDRLYGYSLSPVLWKRVAPKLSAGRVQSVAVRLTVERERERISFVSSEYWDLVARLRTSDGGEIEARLDRIDGVRLAEGKSFDPDTGKLADPKRRLLGETAAKALADAAAEAKPWTVASVERKPLQQKPAPPFITSTLQQEASRKLRFASRRTMQLAQQLYEGIDLRGERVGLITYMRTDSVTLADRAVAQAREVIASTWGADYVPEKPVRYRTSAKRAQEAHEAIRPTDLARRPEDVEKYLDRDQARLYELIWKRTLASQMVPARIERTTVEVGVEVGGEDLTLVAKGRRIRFPGFLAAYVEGSDDPEAELENREAFLPALEKGQVLEPAEVRPDGHATKPPYRYTEASLVRKLEEEGIGRPSTYASILGTIQERGYVVQRGNELVPTFTAFCVTSLLEEQFGDLVDTRFTARMENDLDEIAEGQVEWADLVQAFYFGDDGRQGLRHRIESSEVTYPSVPIGEDPETGETISVKVGRYGPYVRRGEGGKDNVATVPEAMAPDELTLEKALEMLAAKNDELPPVGTDDATGNPIKLQHGRFGAYLEVEGTEDENGKPRRVSLPRGVSADDVTPEVARLLVRLPRDLGRHPESGEEIQTGISRYGPFVRAGKDFRSLDSWEKACTLELAAALEILAEPKKGRGRRQKTVLKDLGEIEGAAGPVQVLDGRYGPYVTDGETNASLPRGTDPAAVDAALAAKLLEERRKAPKKKRAKRARKRT